MSESMLAVIREAREIAAEDAQRELLACPICGNRLEINSAGVKNCDVGHYRTGSAGYGTS